MMLPDLATILYACCLCGSAPWFRLAFEDGVAADGGNQTAEILDSAIDAERDLDVAEKTRVKLLQGLIKKLKAFGQGVAEHEAHDRELEAELGREAAEAEGAQLVAEAARDAAER